MHRSIRPDQRHHRTQDSHKSGKPHTPPISTIVELTEDLVRWRMRGKNPKRDEDGDESTNVKNQDRCLDGRQDFGNDGIDEKRNADQNYRH